MSDIFPHSVVNRTIYRSQIGFAPRMVLLLISSPLFHAKDLCKVKDSDDWRCRKDGSCISSELVCDGKEQCLDGSDEADGCRLFPETDCKSWFGKRHVHCDSNETICTLPHLVHNCRACDKVGYWRCDDGLCIKVTNVQNGKEDCLDGSDEWHETSINFLILLTVLTLLLLVGLITSILSCEVFCFHSRGVKQLPKKPVTCLTEADGLNKKMIPSTI